MTNLYARATLATAATLAVLVTAPAARAEMVKMKAALSGGAEVPANDSAGRGTADLDYDTTTKLLKWSVTYSGLKTPATAGHIHGPAAAGANAGVAVPFANAGTSPITGQATLTDAQAQALTGGLMYVNIHTSAHPGGEIRGQITR
jgi:hypothetical protein